MVSEVASEICTKIGIKVYAGDGGFTIDGVEFNEYLELDAEPPEYKGYRTIPKISILDGVFLWKNCRHQRFGHMAIRYCRRNHERISFLRR